MATITKSTTAEARAISAVVAAETLDPIAFAARFGRDGRGLLDEIVGVNGDLVLWSSNARLVYDTAGRAVGFVVNDATVVNYADPAVLEAVPAPVLLAGPNSGVAYFVQSAEEALARCMMSPSAAAWPLKDRPRRRGSTEPMTILRRAGSRLANAIVAEAINNAIPRQRLGALSAIRRHNPSVRRTLANLLDTAVDTRPAVDLLHQLPLVVLSPPAVRAALAGKSPRKFLPKFGLSASARRVTPRAAGHLAFMAAGRPLLSRGLAGVRVTFPWLDDPLTVTLPAAAFRQVIVVDVAGSVFEATGDAALASEVGVWLSRVVAGVASPAGLRAPRRRLLIDWIVAGPALHSALNVGSFAPALDLATALARADDFAAAVALMRGGSAVPFTLPVWAPREGRIPGSGFRADILATEAELVVEGQRLLNCAGSYGARAASGQSVILVLRRPARQGDKHAHRDPRDVNKSVVTVSMAELIAPGSAAGVPRVAQHFGPRNAPPPRAAVHALHVLLDGMAKP